MGLVQGGGEAGEGGEKFTPPAQEQLPLFPHPSVSVRSLMLLN